MKTGLVGLTVGVLAAIAVTSAGGSPVAAHDSSERAWHKSERQRADERRREARRQRSAQRTAEDREADFYDPTCQYCGYPSWARIALSPKDFNR
jgi:hypothetical protein